MTASRQSYDGSGSVALVERLRIADAPKDFCVIALDETA